jgi:uncharacterized protein
LSGTTGGGKKAAATNKQRYDEAFKDEGGFYPAIGRRGGKISRGGGFVKDSELAKEAGRRGGKVSRRTKDGSMSRPVQAAVPEFFTTNPRLKCGICSQRHATALCPEAL